jgi:hypothetical protein
MATTRPVTPDNDLPWPRHGRLKRDYAFILQSSPHTNRTPSPPSSRRRLLPSAQFGDSDSDTTRMPGTQCQMQPDTPVGEFSYLLSVLCPDTATIALPSGPNTVDQPGENGHHGSLSDADYPSKLQCDIRPFSINGTLVGSLSSAH